MPGKDELQPTIFHLSGHTQREGRIGERGTDRYDIARIHLHLDKGGQSALHKRRLAFEDISAYL